MPTPDNSIRIAILETKQNGTDARLKRIEDKLDEILELINKGKGAFWFGMIAAGGVGSFITKVVSIMWTKTGMP